MVLPHLGTPTDVSKLRTTMRCCLVYDILCTQCLSINKMDANIVTANDTVMHELRVSNGINFD